MTGQALADAAHALEGTRFRLQGRDPATGLDCVGLLAASLHIVGRPVRLPLTYRLRTFHPVGACEWARACDLEPASGPVTAGDVLLARVSPCQFHLLIALSELAFVHAHAGLRRVVRHDGACPWPVVNHWRLIEEEHP